MVLYVHSDASYLSKPMARFRVGGYFYLGKTNKPLENPKPNGPIHVESQILQNIMAAALEAEIGALFHNRQETIHFQQIIYETGPPQAQGTPIATYNSMADGFANKHTKIKQSKIIDMHFYWIQD
jgi:hypothetical protein